MDISCCLTVYLNGPECRSVICETLDPHLMTDLKNWSHVDLHKVFFPLLTLEPEYKSVFMYFICGAADANVHSSPLKQK